MAEDKVKPEKEEKLFDVEQIIQIASIKKHDQLYYRKHYGHLGPMSLKEWNKTAGLTLTF